MTRGRPWLHAVVTRLSHRQSTMLLVASADQRREVLVFFIDAGGGHRAAVRALEAAIEERQPRLRLKAISLQPILEPLDVWKRLTGVSMEHSYNEMVRRGQTGFLVPLLYGLHGLLRLQHRAIVRLLARELAGQRPAIVLSVTPNFNAAIRDAVREALPGVPFVVLLTDLADFPPHFWIEPGLDRVIVGTDHAAAQAVALGIPRDRVVRSSGMPLHPRFHSRAGPDARARARAELGFVPEDQVVLLLFGGNGAPEMEPLAARLLAAASAFRVIAVCGDNETLHERIRAIEARVPNRLRAFGFTDRVAELMAAADVLVTKPGPGALAEAFQQRLPVVVTSNGRTIPQERFNARFVRENGLGLAVRHWREAPAAVAALTLDPDVRAQVRGRLDALPENRAVHEALDVLARDAGHP